MLGDWEFWLRLLAFIGMALGAYRGYRYSIDSGQLSPRGFFLIIALALAYAAVGIGLIFALIELLGPDSGGAVAGLFFGYVVLGVVGVVWFSIRIARTHRPDQRGISPPPPPRSG
jgi:hypothetical protein